MNFRWTKNTKNTSILKSHKGMSLVEIMIVMTIMTLVGLGTATLMKNVVSVQKRTDLKATASIIKSRVEEYIRSETAWEFTVAANVGLRCTRAEGSNCTHNNDNPYTGAFLSGASVYDFNLYTETNSIYMRGANPNGGFNRSGEPCNTFNGTAGAGNNNCPFRYNLAAWFFCTNGQPQCQRPEVTIKAELIFNPRDKSEINDRLNTDDYQISVKRKQKVRSESFLIVYKDPNTWNAADEIGGGNCRQLSPPLPGRQFRPLSDEEFDEGDNVQLTDVRAFGYLSFTVNAGNYECKITTQSYEAIEGYQVVLEDWTSGSAGARYPAGGGYSGPGTTAHSTQPVQLQLTAPAVFRLRHICQVSRNRVSPAPPTPRRWDLGIPVPDYNEPSVYTSISCVRSS